MTTLKDKWDHDRRILPYLISGLFDKNPEIQNLASSYLSERGEQHAIEKEKDYREQLQLGYKAVWTYMGEVDQEKLWFPKPFLERPTFGVRRFVRHYTRRWIKALFRDTKGLTEEYQNRSLELLLAILLFCEEQITSFLDQIVPSCIHACTLMFKKNR